MASLDLAGIITRVCSDLAYRFAPLYHTHSNYASISHAHGAISSVGDITATAPTIASGDKLIINDESASKVTNGPSFGSSTTMFLANNGTWQTPTMEDTDVDAAVEEAWPLPGYLIIDYQGYSRSITLDGTYGSDVTVVETEAFAENVVTVSSGAGILIVTDANGDEVSTTGVDRYTLGGSGHYGPPEYITVFSFIMPESDVTLSI